VQELKYLQQPVAFKVAPSQNNRTVSLNVNDPPVIVLDVVNRYTFRDLSHLKWTWNVTSDYAVGLIASGRFDIDGKTISEGLRIPMKQVVPKVTKEAEKAGYPIKYYLNLRGSLKASTAWAEKGHLLVTEQFNLAFDGLPSPEKPDSKKSERVSPGKTLRVKEEGSSINVFLGEKDSTPIVAVDRSTGTIQSYSPDERSIFASPTETNVAGLVPNFTRAATDNDMGGVEISLGFVLPEPLLMPFLKGYNMLFGSQFLSYLCRWKLHGLDPAFPPATVCESINVKEYDGRVEIEVECAAERHGSSHSLFRQLVTYQVFSDGRIRVTNRVSPSSSLRAIPSLPRVGMSLSLDSSLFNVMYFGRGPHENYPDRQTSAEMGIWATTAKENDFEYIVPSENGSKSDCEWIAFRDESGNGVCVIPEVDTMNFNASLYSQEEFHMAKHTYDLPVRENGKAPVHVNLDHRIMGVGGDTR
jgi:hypothetical protein